MKSCMRAGVFLLTMPLALAACASGGSSIKSRATADVDETRAAAEMLMKARADSRMTVAGPIITDTPYVDVTPIAKADREPLAFSRVVTFNSSGLMSMHTFVQRVQSVAGVRVTYQDEVVRGSVPAGGDSLGAVMTAPLVVNGITMPQLETTVPSPSAPAAGPGVRLNYSGAARGLFDEVAEQTGAHWKWNPARQTVEFYRYETESFRVTAVQGETETSFELGGAQSSAGGDSTLRLADTEAAHKTNASVWKEVESVLAKLVSSEGVYQVTQSAGMVIVRDRPDRMHLVRDYFDRLNTTLARQVDIEVTIYTVQVNDRDFKGVSWDALFQALIESSDYFASWRTARPDVVSENASSAVIRIPLSDENGVAHRYANSALMLDALSTLGKASLTRTASVLTANNRAAPAKFVNRSTYLAETVPTYASGGGTSVGTGAGLTPGSVETGLNMYFLPHVQDDGKRVLLRTMVSISSLDSMDTYSSGDQSIQLPQVSSREFAPEAWLNSGETLVLTSFNETGSGHQTRSPFGRMWGLGGDRTVTHGQELMVIAITPVVTASRSKI